jgi:hypothetical protein
MADVRSVIVLRYNRNQFTEDFACEFPPQQMLAPNRTRVNGCCVRAYGRLAAAAHGDEVRPAAVGQRIEGISQVRGGFLFQQMWLLDGRS